MDYFTIIRRLGLFQGMGTIESSKITLPRIESSKSSNFFLKEKLLVNEKPSIKSKNLNNERNQGFSTGSLQKVTETKILGNRKQLNEKSRSLKLVGEAQISRGKQASLHRKLTIIKESEESIGLAGWSRTSSIGYSKL
jgi:hypothetical protein